MQPVASLLIVVILLALFCAIIGSALLLTQRFKTLSFILGCNVSLLIVCTIRLWQMLDKLSANAHMLGTSI